MTMYNVSGLRGPAVGKVPVAKAPILPNYVPHTGAEDTAAVFAVQGDAKRETQRAVEKVSAALKAAGADVPAQAKVLIRVDKDTQRYVYEFRDAQTDEVLRQYPDKVVLAALAAYRQTPTGLSVDEAV